MTATTTSNEAFFRSEHLRAFEECVAMNEAVEWAAAKNPRKFASLAGQEQLISSLPNTPETRADIINDHSSALANIDAFALRVLAWGGMRADHARRLFKGGDRQWLSHCRDIADGKHDRKSAYARFAEIRKAGNMSGMGPAYFTKLIYFLTPRDSAPIGYIMDQWVSCAVNLLCNNAPVHVSSAHFVSDRNSAANYDSYCDAIEKLAKTVGLTPDETEIALMSKGGREPASWRAYVLANRTVTA